MTQERTPFMTKVIVFVVVFSAIIWAYMRHEQISPRDEAIQELHLPSVPTFLRIPLPGPQLLRPRGGVCVGQRA